MYRALYRKWRPMTFNDVVGQEAIVSALKNQVINEKIGHAYIFTGTRGTGKTTCAKIFAKAVNCPNIENGNPCGECAFCKGVEDSSLLDVVEIDAASNNGVDYIRELREETAYTPSQSRYKVYIIDEVHMLTMQAFNALLKTMEEPPPHIIFILATTEIHKVPATILSRCQRYDFMRIKPHDIVGRLLYIAQQEGIILAEDAAVLIASLADGAMRDALSILDTCAGVQGEVDLPLVQKMAGVTDKGYLFDVSDSISENDITGAITLLAQLREKSIDVKRLCEELVFHYRNLMLAAADKTGELLQGVSLAEKQRYVEKADEVDTKFVIRAIKRLGEALDKMSRGADQRIELELAVFSLCTSAEEPQVKTVYVQQPSVPSQKAVSPVPVDTESRQAPPLNQAKASLQGTDGEAVPCEFWQQVVGMMGERDAALYSFMKNSRGYISGKRILIDADHLFKQFIRQNEYSSNLLKDVIQQVCGERYSIGPYEPKAQVLQNEENGGEKTLKALQQLGVTVEYE